MEHKTYEERKEILRNTHQSDVGRKLWIKLTTQPAANSKSKEFPFNAAYKNILHQNTHLTYYET